MESLTNEAWQVEALRRWAVERGPGFVGAKHPLLCLMLPQVAEAWPGCRVVSVRRRIADCEASILKLGWGWPATAVKTQIRRMVQARDQALADLSIESLAIDYETCVHRPCAAVDMLAAFVGIFPTKEEILEAAAHPRESLHHHGNQHGTKE